MSRGDLKKIGELFCGAGGFAEGAKQAGFSHVWGNDDHEDSCKTFEKNQRCPVFATGVNKFTRKNNLEKIKSEYGNINGLLFGFPCNDFSLVGKKKKMEGDYGGLYTYACKVLDYFEPEFFVAENVTSIGKKFKNNKKQPSLVKDEFAGKLRNRNYMNFKKIMKDLAGCSKHGYRIYADNYKFEEHGVPQKRHRIILVGFRDDIFKENNISYQKPKKENIINCEQGLANIPRWAEHQELTNHDERVVRRLKKTAEGKNVWDLGNDEDGLPGVTKARMSHIYKRLNRNEPSYTVTGSGGGGTHVYHYEEPRALTNRERARLQTFPDDYNFCGGKESIRRQIGMAVPVEGAKKIMIAVKDALKKREQRISYHHEWMIKANGKDLYFTGKESVQGYFDFEE